MPLIEQLRRLWAHAAWADQAFLAELERLSAVPPIVLREYAHILGAEEVWLARLEMRPSRTQVWPELTLPAVAELARDTREGYERYLAKLSEPDLDQSVAYRNSAGQEFTTSIVDILFQVVLHGQYHRGKVNVHLRQAELSPVPADFIAFVRGTPAATTVLPPLPTEAVRSTA
ncbi:MAG: damage-inducible protein DinB [Gemmatimonadetes bacterium]|jgi:uncharacterized damage-inducible protein DinB|nr:damage-inducible protein DinB [Gemmatimonadota bacterium]